MNVFIALLVFIAAGLAGIAVGLAGGVLFAASSSLTAPVDSSAGNDTREIIFDSLDCYTGDEVTSCLFTGSYTLSRIAPSGSMRPLLDDNSNVLMRSFNCSVDNVQSVLGKVVVYELREESKRIIHRCVMVVNNSCIMKGDANTFADGNSLVDACNIIFVADWELRRI